MRCLVEVRGNEEEGVVAAAAFAKVDPLIVRVNRDRILKVDAPFGEVLVTRIVNAKVLGFIDECDV